jgi:hypothetical protein
MEWIGYLSYKTLWTTFPQNSSRNLNFHPIMRALLSSLPSLRFWSAIPEPSLHCLGFLCPCHNIIDENPTPILSFVLPPFYSPKIHFICLISPTAVTAFYNWIPHHHENASVLGFHRSYYLIGEVTVLIISCPMFLSELHILVVCVFKL